MYKKIIVIALLILAATDLSSQKANDSLINSKVYDIGYTSRIFTDYSRTYNSINRELGKQDSVVSYRKITSSIWYPTETKDVNKKMSFSEYLLTTELDEKKDYKTGDSINTSADKFQEYYGINDDVFTKITNTPINSYHNAEFLSEKLPLVIYIQGMNAFSFENHLLCETVANKGYVVISFNSKGRENRWVAAETQDFETQIRDVQFIIGELAKNPSINSNKVILIGHSIGGYVNILTKLRDNRISGLVSLDGSIKHDFKRVDEFVYSDLNKVNCPLLSFSDQKHTKAKRYLDSMIYSDRHYFQMSNFGHTNYKSITYIKKFKPDSITYNTYLSMNKLILSFIENIHTPSDYFANHCNDFSKAESITYSYQPSIHDYDYFMQQSGKNGFDKLFNIYDTIKSQQPSFQLFADDIYKWANRLRYNGYFDFSIEVYDLLIKLYPEFMPAYNGLARTYLIIDKKDEAIKAYESALKIEPDNGSFKRKLTRLTNN